VRNARDGISALPLMLQQNKHLLMLCAPSFFACYRICSDHAASQRNTGDDSTELGLPHVTWSVAFMSAVQPPCCAASTDVPAAIVARTVSRSPLSAAASSEASCEEQQGEEEGHPASPSCKGR
jgi:hypothetical protein